MTSIRRFLMRRLLLGLGLLCIGASSGLYVLVRNTLTTEFDRALLVRAHAVSALLEEDEDEVELNLHPLAMPRFIGGDPEEYFQIWLDGEEDALGISPTLKKHKAELERKSLEPGESLIWDVELPDGRPGRCVAFKDAVKKDDELVQFARRFKIKPSTAGSRAVVVIAKGREDIDRPLVAIGTGLIVACVTLCLAIVFLVTRSVRRGLSPLSRMQEEIETIHAHTLSSRVSAAQLPRELQGCAARINELLGRLEDAFRRERRMLGNVGHELRTPIAELRSYADVAARWEDDPQLQHEANETTRHIARVMGELVNSLIKLSRLQCGETRLQTSPIVLRDLVRSVRCLYDASARERGVAIDDDTSAMRIVTDRELVVLIMRNLLDNAVRHAPPGSAVSITSTVRAGHLDWSIENEAVDLDSDDLDRLAEPFWQKDAAHTAEHHAGLGLPLVKSACEQLGIPLRFALDQGRLRVWLRFPLAPPEKEPALGELEAGVQEESGNRAIAETTFFTD